MTDVDSVGRAIFAELQRLQLNPDDSPYQVMAGDLAGLERLLAKLRAMQPGATWHDVYPDRPERWVPGRPETWREPYRPFGSFDYAAPPAGPAFYVLWAVAGARARHEALVQRARDAGFPVYGGGLTPDRRAGRVDDMGFIVLERGTSEELLHRILDWILAQPGVHHSRLYRTEDEEYAP